MNSYAFAIVDELRRCGADMFFVSPGSRSTPLVAAIANNPFLKYQICHDERSAAYAAIGYAKARKMPAVLVCTSGTAVANYFPAIIEAKSDSVPLIVLSADRPPELWDTQANQTIDQNKIFADHVKYFFNLPPLTSDLNCAFYLTTIDNAVARAVAVPAGPVHINCQIREPLVFEGMDGLDNRFKVFRKDINLPYTQYFESFKSSDIDLYNQVLDDLCSAKRPIIIVGKICCDKERFSILKFAEKTGIPVFPDIQSGMRLITDKLVINNYDLIFTSEAKNLRPDAVLHIGGRVVSKRLMKTLEKIKPNIYIHLNAEEARMDQGHIVTTKICTDISEFLEKAIKSIKKCNERDFAKDMSVLNYKINEKFKRKLNKHFLDELLLPSLIAQIVADNSTIYLGNSMPIRDFDSFLLQNQKNLTFHANRGASGIDGIISSAIGYTIGRGSRTIAVIGDVSALHDLNALSLLRTANVPLTLIIINNNGGGIFNFLAVEKKDYFYEFFNTPTNINFELAAKMFNLDYFSPKNPEELIDCMNNEDNKDKPIIIELITDKEQNINTHNDFYRIAKSVTDDHFKNSSVGMN